MKAQSLKLKVEIDTSQFEKIVDESVTFTVNARERDLGMTSDQLISLHGKKCLIVPMTDQRQVDKAINKAIKVREIV